MNMVMTGGGYGAVSIDQPENDDSKQKEAAVVYPMSSGSLLQYSLNQESV